MAQSEPPLGNSLQIVSYMHCSQCLNEIPRGQSPETWARLSVGFTPRGLQVWCTRHNANVCNIDFEGCKHPADVSTKKD